MVSLSPVSADEGYIPYFPDFMEPDGIGFRGTAENTLESCWSNYYSDPCDQAHEGVGSVQSNSGNLASPITFEYRKNYFYKRLLYSQVFADFGSTQSNSHIKGYPYQKRDNTPLTIGDIDTNTFL